jgi:prolipoprotein diacylglyceryltransferase
MVFVVLPVLFAYCRLNGQSFRCVADTVAVPALAIMAIVRIGCFLAGCRFGDVSGHTGAVARNEDPLLRLQVQTVHWLSHAELPWALHYPADSLVGAQHAALGLVGADAASKLPVHPVRLYETLLLALLALAIVRLRPVLARPGSEALVVLGSYAGVEFLLEFLRGDNALVLGPLTVNQFICTASLAAAVLLAALQRRRTAPVAASGLRD